MQKRHYLLNSDQLDAFETVARLGKFSLAAKELGITQPALSRRIQALEATLGMTLFIRHHAGVELTSESHRLISFVESRNALESELRDDLGNERDSGLGGTIRIAGYSSLLNHIVTPALAPLMRANPRMQIQLIAIQGVRPSHREFGLVERAEADLLITWNKLSVKGLETHFLGEAELVAIQSSKHKTREETFLDARPEDSTTELFFDTYPQHRIAYLRSHLYDEEGIIRGVSLGLGRAIVIKRMLHNTLPVQPIPGWKSLRGKIYATFRKQQVYSKLFKQVRKALIGT